MDLINEVKKIEYIRLKPDDILLITVKNNTCFSKINLICEETKKCLKDSNYNNNILIIPEDCNFKTISKNDYNSIQQQMFSNCTVRNFIHIKRRKFLCMKTKFFEWLKKKIHKIL